MNKTAEHANMTTSRPSQQASARYVWLSSLRAFGVVLVLVYHFFPALLPAGFIGVDVFFVFSGFLITSLLIREYSVTGRIALGAFYLRRLKRLLPAILAMLAVTLPLALLVSPDFRVGIAQQTAAVLGWVTNYYEIINGQSYANQLLPHLFVHTWTLSIEMQYYLLWGLLLALLVGRLSRTAPDGRISTQPARRTLSIVAAAAAAVSFALMQVFLIGADDPSHAYFDTLSHLFPLLIGSFVGLQAGFPRTRLIAAVERLPFALALLAAALCLAGIVAMALLLSFENRLVYHAAILLTALLTATVLILGRAHQARLYRIRESRIVNYLSDRSYSLYLFHWPLFIIASNLGSPGSPLPLPGFQFLDTWVFPPLALVTTFVLSHLSFRFVEAPFTSAGKAARRAAAAARKEEAARRAAAQAVEEGAAAAAATDDTAQALAASDTMPTAQAALHQESGDVTTASQKEMHHSLATLPPIDFPQEAEGAKDTGPLPLPQTDESDVTEDTDQLPPAKTLPLMKEGGNRRGARIIALAASLALLAVGAFAILSAPAQNTVTATNEEELLDLDVAQISSLSTRLNNLRLEPVVGMGTAAGLPLPPSAGGGPGEAPPVAIENMEGRVRGDADGAAGTITVLGDSVCLGAVPQIEELTGAYVDADGYRKMQDAVPLVEGLQVSGALGEYVVIAMATNIFPNSIEKTQEIIDNLEPGHHLIFVTAYGIDLEFYGLDAFLRELPSRYPWISLADWNAYISNHADLLSPDGIHTGAPESRIIYAQCILDAVRAAQGGPRS